MVTLPRDSVMLYATLVISFWISSEWYFLPRTAFRPVTVFLMLEVICHQNTGRVRRERSAHQGAGCVRTPLSAASPCFRSLSVKPTMHLVGVRVRVEPCRSGTHTRGADQPGSGAQQLTQWSAWTPHWPARRCHRDAQLPRLPRGRGAIKKQARQPGLAVVWIAAAQCCRGCSHRQCRNRRRCRCTTCLLLTQLGTCTGQTGRRQVGAREHRAEDRQA